MRLILASLALATFAGAAAAQSCATLTVTGNGAPGTDLVFTLQGAANAPAFLAVGDTTGSTTFNFGPLGSLSLDLAQPFAPLPLGVTDGSGEVSLTAPIPPGLPAVDLFAQGVTVTFTRPPNLGLAFCTSNVVSFHVGP